jgi:hypothetical protein
MNSNGAVLLTASCLIGIVVVFFIHQFILLRRDKLKSAAPKPEPKHYVEGWCRYAVCHCKKHFMAERTEAGEPLTEEQWKKQICPDCGCTGFAIIVARIEYDAVHTPGCGWVTTNRKMTPWSECSQASSKKEKPL